MARIKSAGIGAITDDSVMAAVRLADEQAIDSLETAYGALKSIGELIGGSRELSLAITNVEQAMLWQAAARSTVGSIVELTTSHRHQPMYDV